MAVFVVDYTLMWFEDQEAENTEDAILNLARQFTALRVTAVTGAGRRLSDALLDFRVQYRELQVRRLQLELANHRLALTWACSDGRGYLAQLRAVLMAYRPGRAVTTPMAFPGPSQIFDEIGVDTHALDDALENDLGVSDRTRRRLIANIPH